MDSGGRIGQNRVRHAVGRPPIPGPEELECLGIATGHPGDEQSVLGRYGVHAYPENLVGGSMKSLSVPLR